MTLSSEDLFGRQGHTWASSPYCVQTIILKNIRKTIKAKLQKEHRIRKIAVKGLLTTGLQSPPRFRVSRGVCPRRVGLYGFRISCRVGHPCVGLHGFTVKLPATCVLGPWWAPWITETIPRKLSRLPISARHRPPSSSGSPFTIPICRRRTAHSRWPSG